MSLNKKKSKPIEDNDNDDAFNETFVTYGTELPDISEQDKGKFQPVWKQEVTLLSFNRSKALRINTNKFFLLPKGS
jgi:hypothetical protein